MHVISQSIILFPLKDQYTCIATALTTSSAFGQTDVCFSDLISTNLTLLSCIWAKQPFQCFTSQLCVTEIFVINQSGQLPFWVGPTWLLGPRNSLILNPISLHYFSEVVIRLSWRHNCLKTELTVLILPFILHVVHFGSSTWVSQYLNLLYWPSLCMYDKIMHLRQSCCR